MKTREEYRNYMVQYRKTKGEKLWGLLQWRMKNPEKALYKRVKDNSKLRHIEFKLTFPEFIQEVGKIPETCPVLGIPITVDLGIEFQASVDRLDPTKGYIPGNIAIISYRANLIKSIGSAAEHLAIAKWMTEKGVHETKGEMRPRRNQLAFL